MRMLIAMLCFLLSTMASMCGKVKTTTELGYPPAIGAVFERTVAVLTAVVALHQGHHWPDSKAFVVVVVPLATSHRA